jgi:predicted naringenin-chalcone synthase
MENRPSSMLSANIVGLGVELPQYALSQTRAYQHAQSCCCCDSPARARVLERLYKRTEISNRSIVLQTSETAGIEQFFPSQGAPSTALRMERYAADVIPLALAASRNAISDSGVDVSQLKQLVTVSCTGFVSPGFDLALIKELNLDPSIGRTHIGFMGCHGSLNALRVASSFCKSGQAPVLLCSAELCSLHFQYDWGADNILANALFADGAAALVLGSAPKTGSWRVFASKSFVIPDTADLMSWSIGDSGFSMTLSARVADVIREKLRPWLESWLLSLDLPLAAVGSWAIHPGGPRILDAVQDCLGLSDETLLPSRTVFEECGNMSSPTVLFILQRLRQVCAAAPVVMLAFGPGLTIEAALLVAADDTGA